MIAVSENSRPVIEVKNLKVTFRLPTGDVRAIRGLDFILNENEVLAASDDPERTYIEEVMPAKLALNLQYIDNQSLKEDFKLIFKTFTAILSH